MGKTKLQSRTSLDGSVMASANVAQMGDPTGKDLFATGGRFPEIDDSVRGEFN